jgi:hypothetical protein
VHKRVVECGVARHAELVQHFDVAAHRFAIEPGRARYFAHSLVRLPAADYFSYFDHR